MRRLLKKDLIGDTSAHERGALRIVQSSLRIALASGFTWAAGTLAAALMTCWGAGAWVILPVALLVTFTIALMVNAARVAVREGGPGTSIYLPDPELFSDGAVQSLARRLTAARTSLERVLRDSPRGLGIDVPRVQQSVSQMERRVLVLAARAEYVASHLGATSAAEINNALERARKRAAAGDAAAGDDRREIYRPLIETYEAHLQSYRALESEKEKLLAAAERLVGTLEALPANLTHLQCLRLNLGDEDANQTSIEDTSWVHQSREALEEALQEASQETSKSASDSGSEAH